VFRSRDLTVSDVMNNGIFLATFCFVCSQATASKGVQGLFALAPP
jgi:hypothetical protein